MRKKSKCKPLSEAEKRRRLEQRRQARLAARPLSGRLLYTRDQARYKLGGISIATIIRLEQKGLLHPVKPGGSRMGKTFYSDEELTALAKGEA